MYFTVKTCRGYQYLHLMESIHVKGKRNPKKRLVKNFGRFDELPEEIRRTYENETERKALARRLESELLAKNISDATEILEKIRTTAGAGSQPEPGAGNFNKTFALRYGHLALKGIWDKTLGLKYKLDYIQKSKTEIESWSLNDLLFYLCSVRLIEPSSYLAACVRKSDYFYCPWNDVAQDNFYRALDVVYDHKEDILRHAVKSRLRESKTEVKVAFFDCTNTWFETPYDDIVWQVIRFVRQTREELTKEGKTPEEIDAYLSGEAFEAALAGELKSKEDSVVRMRGCSKEGRFAQPIVTVALAIDQTGFPIDCKVFAGNLSEVRTIEPMLESLKKKYSIKDVYFVADRGLNSTASLDKIQQEKLGFIVAQRVSHQTADVRKDMMSLDGYRNCHIDDAGVFHSDSSDGLIPEAFRYKVCDFEKTALVEDSSLGMTAKGNIRKKSSTVSCKIIFTYSPERRDRDLAELEDKIAKANNAISNRILMGNPNGSGWRALIKTQKEAAKNKNDKDQYRAVGLKENVIAERREIAGYAAVVYSHPDIPDHQNLMPEQVLETYHRLVAIEDCFRVMKSNFSIRPVHVRLKERITAHCYLCVMSLMLLKILSEKLEKTGVVMSNDNIMQALSQALIMPVPNQNGKGVTFLNAGLHPCFHTPSRAGKGRVQNDLNDLLDHAGIFEAFKNEREARPDDIDQILRAVGMQPPALFNTMGELKKRFGLHTLPDSVMMAEEHKQYLATLMGT